MAAELQRGVSVSDVPVRAVRLVKRYGDRTVLDGLDLALRPGEFLALLGPSGCGKTTLLRLLAGLDVADGGVVDVPDAHAVVFQEPRLLPWQRVWRNVVLGLPGRSRERALRALAEVRLEGRADDWPVTLSGGEAQRAALARALVREPKLLLLDEPFAALDALTRIRMHELVLELWRAHGPAVLLVTHDVDEALLLADRLVVMRDGRLPVDIDVRFDRPRRRGDPAFDELRTRLLAELGVFDRSTANQEAA
jgi:sulfonate transport system ATP-binding protein